AVSIGEAAAVGPVDLGLEARRGLEANGGFGQRPIGGHQRAQVTTQQVDGALVAHGTDLIEESDGGKRRLLEATIEVWLVGVERGGAWCFLKRRWSRLGQGLGDGVARVAGEASDLAL